MDWIAKIRSAINYPFLLAPHWFHDLIGRFGYCLCFTVTIDKNSKHHPSNYIWRTNEDWRQRFKTEMAVNTNFFETVLKKLKEDKMNKSDWGVHESHCCVLHGCKYSNDDCPVETRLTKQDDLCEDCETDGIETIPDPSDPDYDLLVMCEWELRHEAIELRRQIMELKNARI